MRAVALVDEALDRYVAKMRKRGLLPTGVRSETLAYLVDERVVRMQQHLQRHRLAQAREGATRYVVQASGYGVRARWTILAKPGDDPEFVRFARKQAAIWVVEDATQRAFRDVLYEVNPALRDLEGDERITKVMESTKGVMAIQLDLAQSLLAQ